MPTPAPRVPDALLLVTTGCPHCPTVLAGLSELVKAGRIGRLEVVNVSRHPEAAQRLGVRSLPWLRLGPFELDGLRSFTELARWAERAGTEDGMADYFDELLREGRLKQAVDILARDPAQFGALLRLIERPDTELQVRVGVSALMEEYEGTAPLMALVERLGELTRHKDAHIRGDACHFLALTRDPRALAYLRALRNDPEPQVRELAAEGLATLARTAAAAPDA